MSTPISRRDNELDILAFLNCVHQEWSSLPSPKIVQLTKEREKRERPITSDGETYNIRREQMTTNNFAFDRLFCIITAFLMCSFLLYDFIIALLHVSNTTVFIIQEIPQCIFVYPGNTTSLKIFRTFKSTKIQINFYHESMTTAASWQ